MAVSACLFEIPSVLLLLLYASPEGIKLKGQIFHVYYKSFFECVDGRKGKIHTKLDKNKFLSYLKIEL